VGRADALIRGAWSGSLTSGSPSGPAATRMRGRRFSTPITISSRIRIGSRLVRVKTGQKLKIPAALW